MAVKLDVSNSIINAYAQGKAEATQAQELKKKTEQQQLENEQRQAQIDEAKRQFDEQLKNEKANQAATHAHEKAQLDLQHLIANQGFIDAAEKSGNPPPGFTPTGSEQFEISPGVFGSRIIANDSSGNTIRYRTSQAVNQQNIEFGKATRAQLITEEKNMKDYEAKLQENLSKLTAEQRLNAEKVLQTQEETFKQNQAERDFKHDLALQQEKDRVNLQIAGIKGKGEEVWNDIPLDPKALEAFGLPRGSTWKDALGAVKLDTVGKKNFEAGLNIEPLIMDSQSTLDQVTDNGKRGYDRYFLGAGKGIVGDITQKIPGMQDSYVTNASPVLGNLFLKAKELANLGSAFTPTEKKFLADYVPGAERSLTPQLAESMLNHLIDAVRLERLNTIKVHGTKVGTGSSTNIKISTEKTSNPNLNDLGDGFKLLPDEVK